MVLTIDPEGIEKDACGSICTQIWQCFAQLSGILSIVSDPDSNPNPDCIRIYFWGLRIRIQNPDPDPSKPIWSPKRGLTCGMRMYVC